MAFQLNNPDTSNLRSRTKPIAIWAVVFVVGIVGFLVYRSLQFHVVAVDPGSTNVSNISSYIRFNFSQPLYKPSVQIAANPDLFSSYSVSEKSITLILAAPLPVDNSYDIALRSITSVKGAKLDVNFKFKVKNIPFQRLSKQQQAAILAKQSTRLPSRNNYTYFGFEPLLKQGVPVIQVEDLKQASFLYAQQAKLNTKQITIKKLVINPFDIHSGSTTANATFTLIYDSAHSYNAKFEFSELTVGRLYLCDTTSGNQIYDSGNIDLQANPS